MCTVWVLALRSGWCPRSPALRIGRQVQVLFVTPLHTAPSRALASAALSLERTGGLCARAGGGGVRPGPEVYPTTLVRPEKALGGGRDGVGAQDHGCFVVYWGETSCS